MSNDSLLVGDERANWLQDATDMIDWLRTNPDIPIARYCDLRLVVFSTWFDEPPKPGEVAKAMRKADKNAYGYFELQRHFGKSMYEFNWPREEVCVANVTGTKDIVRRVPSDPDRAALLEAELAALMVDEVVGQEDVVEYACPESLLKGAA